MQHQIALLGGLAAAVALASAPALAHPGGGVGGGFSSGMGASSSMGVGGGGGFSSGFGVRTSAPSSLTSSSSMTSSSVTSTSMGRSSLTTRTPTTDSESSLTGPSKPVMLPGLAEGMVLRDSKGVTIGTITKVDRASNGAVRSVMVTPNYFTNVAQHPAPINPSTITMMHANTTGASAITTLSAADLRASLH